MKLVFLGPPGAGKGTMASRLSRHMNIPHISTGDIIRAAIRNETELGNQVKDIVEGGGLVPDDLTIELVEERLKFDDTREGYILDGFPRTIVQAEALENMEKIDHVINFELSDEEIIRRLSGRRVHKPTGRTYHVMFNPPKVEGKDDVTGEDLIIRPDDREEAVAKRLSIYREQTEPLIQYYQKKSLLEHLDTRPRCLHRQPRLLPDGRIGRVAVYSFPTMRATRETD
jgi:adenylate kinase